MIRSEPIGNCVVPVETRDPARDKPGGTFRYIDLSSVDKDRKIIDTNLVQEIESQDAPSRARQSVSSGDILVSTVRPNLNGIAIVPDELDGATASTGYCVLRCNERLDPLYLYYWVQTPDFVSDMVRKATGANYPAVTDRVVKTSTIPLPPLATQKHIARVLEQADQLRKQAQQMESELNQLAQSLFLEMFGDPVENAKNWRTVTVGEISPVKGEIVDGPFGSTLKPGCYVDSGVRVIRNYNIKPGRFDGSAYKFVTQEKYEEIKRSNVRPNDILISTKGTVGNFCIAPDLSGPSVLSASGTVRWRMTNSGWSNVFIVFQAQMPSFQDYIARSTGGAVQKYLNLSGIRELRFIAPPYELQQQFERILADVSARKLTLEHKTQALNDLFESLMQRAFNGELTAPERKAA